MADRYRTVLLFGTPGAGKGTQGAILGQVPGFFHFSSGDMFRTLDTHSELGRKFHEFSSRGELVPDGITMALTAEHLHAQTVLHNYQPHVDLLMLDGLPRTEAQAKLISEHIEVLGIVHLTLEREEAVRRLQGRAQKQKRADDAKEEVIRNRLEIYERETKPVLDYYSDEITHRVNAVGSPLEVLQKILAIVAPIHDENFETDL